jgi:hypothetical protein
MRQFEIETIMFQITSGRSRGLRAAIPILCNFAAQMRFHGISSNGSVLWEFQNAHSAIGDAVHVHISPAILHSGSITVFRKLSTKSHRRPSPKLRNRPFGHHGHNRCECHCTSTPSHFCVPSSHAAVPSDTCHSVANRVDVRKLKRFHDCFGA